MGWAAHVPGWAAIVLAVAAAWYVRRHGGGTALEELERANRVLERRVKELEDTNQRQGAELVALRSRTDVATVMAPLLDALRMHEEQAERRTSRTLDVLDMIAARLGPEREAA